MLHVDLFRLVTGKSRIEVREQSGMLVCLELLPVQKVGGAVLITEDKPVIARCSEGLAFLQEGPEGRDTGAWPDHDDWSVTMRRQSKSMRGLDEYPRLLPRPHAL